MALRKRIWIPLTSLVLLGVLFGVAWFYVPEYAEQQFKERMQQVGIETDSIEFRIEGMSRPVVRDLSLRISGVNLVAESIEFGSFFDGYGEDRPLKITVNGLWAGVNAQVPEGLLSVNNAILALPEKTPFQTPLPLEIHFKEGVVHYENRGRAIEGIVDGHLSVVQTRVDWTLDIDVDEHPVVGRGFFNWSSGLMDLSGEMELSHILSQALWDILNEEPMFDWNEGRFQTAFRFEGDKFNFQNGQVHTVLNNVSVGFEGVDISSSNHVASMLWTPGHMTFEFTGNGQLSRLIEAPFDWTGTLSVEEGRNLHFELSEASVSPDWEFGSVQVAHTLSNEIPLEVSVLGSDDGFDFQILGLDLLLSSEMQDQLSSGTLDIMFNGHLQDQMLSNASVDLWFRDGLFMAPMFQSEIGEGLLNFELETTTLDSELFAGLVMNPGAFVRYANMSDVTLFRYSDLIGERINVNWTPGADTSVEVSGEFAGIGAATLAFQPEGESSLRESAGTLLMSPGNFELDYDMTFDPTSGLETLITLEDYAIEEYPYLERWITGEFDVTGLLSADFELKVTPHSVAPSISYQLESLLYAGGNLVLDNVSYAGKIHSLEPFHMTSEKPFTVSTIQVNGWTASDFSTSFEIGKRINISGTTLSAFGGSIELANISMNPEELYIDSEIGVTNLQTEEILNWIPKVIGAAEGSIDGIIPFQWDMKNSIFSLGHGHLHSPEGELGSMNLRIFRPEDDSENLERDDRYSMVDDALSNLQDSSLNINILPPSGEAEDTRVRLNIKGFVDSRVVKAPVDVVRYYNLPLDSFNLTMEQVRKDLPGIRGSNTEQAN